MGHAGADGDRIRALFHTFELRDARNIHNELGPDQTQVEHGTERLSAGQDLGDRSVPPDQRERTPDVGRALVLESDRLHRACPPGADARSIV